MSIIFSTDPHRNYRANKAKSGDFESIRYCLGCLQACVMHLLTGTGISCVVNPEIGLEYKVSV